MKKIFIPDLDLYLSLNHKSHSGDAFDHMSSAHFYVKENSSFIKVGLIDFFLFHKDFSSSDFIVSSLEHDELFRAAKLYDDEIYKYDIYIHNLLVFKKFRNNGFASKIISWLKLFSQDTERFILMTSLDHQSDLKSFYSKSFNNIDFKLFFEEENLLCFESSS